MARSPSFPRISPAALTTSARTRARQRTLRAWASHAFVALPLVLAVGFIARHAYTTATADPFLVRPGDAVPDVRLLGEGLAPTTLAAVAAAGPTVVVLHAPGCAPCDAQVEAAREAAARIPIEQRPAVVAMSVEVPDRAGFAAAHPGIPLYADVERTFAPRYRLRKLPAIVTVGRDGRVAAARSGYRPLGDVHDLVRALD